MAQIGAARDQAQPDLDGYRLEPPERLPVTFALGVASSLADVEPVHKQRVANVGGIVGSIKLTISHQQVEAVDAA